MTRKRNNGKLKQFPGIGTGLSPVDLLQAELKRVYNELHVAMGQNSFFVSLLCTVVNADHDGERLVTAEEFVAAKDRCLFRIQVGAVDREDGTGRDFRVKLSDLTEEEQAEVKKLAKEGTPPAPKGRIIEP